MLPDNSNILGFTDKHQGLYNYLKSKQIYHIKDNFMIVLTFYVTVSDLGFIYLSQ